MYMLISNTYIQCLKKVGFPQLEKILSEADLKEADKKKKNGCDKSHFFEECLLNGERVAVLLSRQRTTWAKA